MSDYSSHFGINNVPFGVARSVSRPDPQGVTRFGNDVVFLADLARRGGFDDLSNTLALIFSESTLNTFAASSKDVYARVRKHLQKLCADGLPADITEHVDKVELLLPVRIGDFTDFSISKDHVQNAPKALFGVPALPKSWYHFPMGYAGRCSSICPSGQPIRRPVGHYVEDWSAKEQKVVFGASRSLDYEFEVGVIVGRPVPKDSRGQAKEMDDHIFGFVLVNDWSARDIQGCEMRDPLGPFSGKKFATSVSPWIITHEALEPFRVPAPVHEERPIEAFDASPNTTYDLAIEGQVIRNAATTTVCKVGYSGMYWTFAQLLAYQALGGCPLNTGDLLASGTVSGSTESSLGSLLELSMNGQRPFQLGDGSQLRYLEDGDTVRFTAVAGRPDAGVGFGECVGLITSASAE